VSTFDKNHGLLVGDVEFNKPPCVINVAHAELVPLVVVVEGQQQAQAGGAVARVARRLGGQQPEHGGRPVLGHLGLERPGQLADVVQRQERRHGGVEQLVGPAEQGTQPGREPGSAAQQHSADRR
jgi:hypothetical protein